MTLNNLGQQAYHIVEELAVRIGPRPAGSAPLLCNADMGRAEVREHCRLDDAGKSLLCAAMSQLG